MRAYCGDSVFYHNAPRLIERATPEVNSPTPVLYSEAIILPELLHPLSELALLQWRDVSCYSGILLSL